MSDLAETADVFLDDAGIDFAVPAPRRQITAWHRNRGGRPGGAECRAAG
jgi:hypothetical protein